MQENTQHKKLAFNEGLQQIADQHLEYVMGAGRESTVTKTFSTLWGDHLKIKHRKVFPEKNGTHPNNGTYIPPTDPATHQQMRAIGLNPDKLPENVSCTRPPGDQNITIHTRPPHPW